ncbi:MAG TPA: MFS transporter [Candidatus Acetothermia bacterium]|nr:MFS transporter [Candidatus Acetothermia bacterium]
MRELFKVNRTLAIYLVLSNFALYFGFRVWQALFNNFAVAEIGVGPAEIGGVQAIREIPGLLGFLVGFLVLALSETRLMAFSIVALGAGIALTGWASTIPSLLLGTLVMSVGFHLFTPANNAVLLMVVDKSQGPKALGQLRSLGAASALVATGVVYLLANRIGYRGLFWGVGGLAAVVGLLLMPFRFQEDHLPPARQVRFRKRYWLYYTLAFLLGSRRHIFTTFAIFLLVREHGIPVQTTALLFLANSLVNTYAYQRIGKLVARFGERQVLSVGFGLLILVFLGYAYIPYLPLLYALFVLDNMIFGTSMANSTYLQKIAVTEEELTSNLSLQQTLNHIAAIVIPVLGGTIWALFGPQAPFLMGVGIVILSLVLVQFMRLPAPATPATTARPREQGG